MGGAIKKPLDQGQVDDIILPWVADEVPACLNMSSFPIMFNLHSMLVFKLYSLCRTPVRASPLYYISNTGEGLPIFSDDYDKNFYECQLSVDLSLMQTQICNKLKVTKLNTLMFWRNCVIFLLSDLPIYYNSYLRSYGQLLSLFKFHSPVS